ncbi:unnamed protein product [Ranitomeya imitator]|uniref:Uncharacterized protein n=1 Tax=Ranitomeya imitator TaxID=111125 RepID=A0ABN9MD71_9NEOB|nr:unnamed protein product [Ranitomeya imitator]
MKAGHTVICGGGGGIPVVKKDNGYVVDKDLTAAVLGEIDRSRSSINPDGCGCGLSGWGTPDAKALDARQ